MKAYNIDEEDIKNSIKVNGEICKQVICMEEMAELTQQISKSLRGKRNKEHLTEEFGDVLIMLETLKTIHNLDDAEIQEWIDYKMTRQNVRDKAFVESQKEAKERF